MKSSIERIVALSKGKATDRVLVDLGTGGHGALQIGSAAGAFLGRSGHARCLADGLGRSLCVHAPAAAVLGSDFLRVGWHRGADVRTADAVPALSLGLNWLLADQKKTRLTEMEILSLRLREPAPWPLKTDAVGQPDDWLIRALAPPIEGPLALLGVLLGRQTLSELLNEPPRRAARLLDWAFSTYSEVYLQVISGLAEPPHMIWHLDNFLAASPRTVRKQLLPRWRECLRQVGNRALTAMKCDENAWAVLPELAEVGVEIASPIGSPAPAMIVKARQAVPDRMILHGVTDFEALFAALRGGRAQALIDLAGDLAELWPVIASPRSPLPLRVPLADLTWAADYLKTLDVGNRRARRQILAERHI